MSPNRSKFSLDAAFDAAEEHQLSFLLFSLGRELYGTPLLSTREVLKPRDIKPMPYMVPSFKGVINLRGQIISVIDLRDRYGIKPPDPDHSLILIVEGAHGLLGALVDDLVSVEKIQKDDIDQSPAVETKIPLDFFLGVAKVKDRLVNMVDVAGCLSAEDLRVIKSPLEEESKKGEAA